MLQLLEKYGDQSNIFPRRIINSNIYIFKFLCKHYTSKDARFLDIDTNIQILIFRWKYGSNNLNISAINDVNSTNYVCTIET